MNGQVVASRNMFEQFYAVNPIQTIESFNKRFGLTLAEGEMVKASFAQETGETMWNVIQAYTGSARAPELTVEAAYRLERVGGQILALVK